MAFTTWNPADNDNCVLSNGNLTAEGTFGGGFDNVRAAHFQGSGKLYCEFTVDDTPPGSDNPRVGIADSTHVITVDSGDDAVSWMYQPNGLKRTNSTPAAYGASWTAGDVISMLLDADAGTLSFWKNGVDQGTAFTGLSGSFAPIYGDFDGAAVTANFGASAFAHTPPEGYVGWGGDPDPSVGDGSPIFEELEAAGHVTYGAASFEAMTAVPPHGVAAFGGLTASATALVGSIAAGTAAFEGLTTSAGAGVVGVAAFEDMVVAADSSAGSAGQGDAAFAAPTATGQGTGASVAQGDATFAEMSAAGFGPDAGAAAFSAMSASASGLTGTAARGAPSFETFDVAAASESGSVALGDARFHFATVAGTGVQPTVAQGVAAFLLMRAQASGLAGTAASGDGVFAPMEVLASAQQPTVAVGAAEFERMVPSAIGYPALSGGFRAWVTNVSNDALTEYQNYPFNSFAAFAGAHYGAGPGGIHRLDGPDDAGAAIAWTLRTGMLDGSNVSRNDAASGSLPGGGAGALKRLEELLMSVRFDGPIRVRVWTDDTTYFDYNVTNHRADVVHQVRAKLGKGLRSKLFRVQLFGLNNARAELSRMELPLQPLKRRLG